MNIDPGMLDQIAFSLAEHYQCVYYADIETGHYVVFSDKLPEQDAESEFPTEGDDFFADALKNSVLFIHPDDMELMTAAYQKDTVLEKLSKNHSYAVSFRSLVAGKVIHMRHVVTMCRDKKHVVLCLENVEAEFLEKEAQLKKLASAKLQARTDELTGVKNSMAFKEYVDQLDVRIAEKEPGLQFAVVMFDINDLKQTNDTRGHTSGNAEIRETSRLICGTFQHSPVFRVGGDEFVAVLTGPDYSQRSILMSVFHDVSDANRRSGSGPVVAAGMTEFGSGDNKFSDVFQRADRLMYENKKATKVT